MSSSPVSSIQSPRTIALEIGVDYLKGLLAEAHAGLIRALDYRAVTPEGLAIKADVRDALKRTGYKGDLGFRRDF